MSKLFFCLNAIILFLVASGSSITSSYAINTVEIYSDKNVEFENHLAKANIIISWDERIQDADYLKAEEIKNNIKNALRIAAQRGPKTRESLIKCIKRSSLIVFDPERSKRTIETNLKPHLSAQYHIAKNEISLLGLFNGKYSADLLIHECDHVNQFWDNLSYDEALLSKCFKNLSDWKNDLERYLKGGVARPEAAQIEAYAANYQNEKHTVRYPTEVSKEAAWLGFLTFGNNTMITLLTKSPTSKLNFYEELLYVENKDGGSRRLARQEEKNAFTAYRNASFLLPTIDRINEESKKSVKPKKLSDLREKHAYLAGFIPERILDDKCSEGFGTQENPKLERSQNHPQVQDNRGTVY